MAQETDLATPGAPSGFHADAPATGRRPPEAEVVTTPSAPAADPASGLLPRTASGSSALILCHEARDRAHFQARVRRAGAIAVVPDPDEADQAWCVTNATRFDYCLIDADFAGDTNSTLDLCMRIKNSAPHVPIILLDDAGMARDPTAERMSLCDGRLPQAASSPEFFAVVQAAILRQSMQAMVRNRPVGGLSYPRALTPPAQDCEEMQASAGWWIGSAIVVGLALWLGIFAVFRLIF